MEDEFDCHEKRKKAQKSTLLIVLFLCFVSLFFLWLLFRVPNAVHN